MCPPMEGQLPEISSVISGSQKVAVNLKRGDVPSFNGETDINHTEWKFFCLLRHVFWRIPVVPPHVEYFFPGAFRLHGSPAA